MGKLILALNYRQTVVIIRHLKTMKKYFFLNVKEMRWSDLHDVRDAQQKSSTANYKYNKLLPSEILQYWFTVAV